MYIQISFNSVMTRFLFQVLPVEFPDQQAQYPQLSTIVFSLLRSNREKSPRITPRCYQTKGVSILIAADRAPLSQFPGS